MRPSMLDGSIHEAAWRHGYDQNATRTFPLWGKNTRVVGGCAEEHLFIIITLLPDLFPNLVFLLKSARYVSFREVFNGWAGTHKVTIAIGSINSAYGWPVLAGDTSRWVDRIVT